MPQKKGTFQRCAGGGAKNVYLERRGLGRFLDELLAWRYAFDRERGDARERVRRGFRRLGIFRVVFLR